MNDPGVLDLFSVPGSFPASGAMIAFTAGSSGVLEGTLRSIAYRHQRTGHTVGLLELVDGRRIKVVGTLADAEPDMSLTIDGTVEQDPRFGLQFRIASVIDPIADAAIAEGFLASGVVPHVGPSTAAAIVAAFGADTLRILAVEPDRLTAFRGLTDARLPLIRAALRVELPCAPAIGLLDPFGVSLRVCRRVQAHYGAGVVAQVRTNPWRLAVDIAGVGFRTADRIALGLGFATDDPRRSDAAIMQAARDLASEGGHITNPAEVLVATATALTGLGPDHAATSLARLGADGTLEVTRSPAGYALPRLAAAERLIAQKLRAISTWADEQPLSMSDAELAAVEAAEGIVFDPSQRRAIKGCLEGRLAVITGGPGTGKTTITRAVLDLSEAAGLSVAAISPTGRAAKRLSEATGRPAQTIHRWLHYSPTTGFAGPASDPDLLVVDEASMLDSSLAARLLSFLRPYTRLLIVGDADQLPAIGPGNVLGDLLASPFAVVYRLDVIHRTDRDSAIPRLAAQINAGLRTPAYDGSSARFVKRGTDPAVSSDVQAQEIADWICKRIDRQRDIAADIQILCPMKRGASGTDALNRAIQALLNPAVYGAPTLRRDGFDLRAGDRIMQTTNDYEADLFNGDVGYLREVRADGSCIVDFDGAERSLAAGGGTGFTLAYAMTVHKAQGSEFPVVIIPMHTSSYMLLERRLLYTAVSRARRTCVIVGSPKAVAMAIGRHEQMGRRTLLRSLLGGFDEDAPLIDPAALADEEDDF